MSEKHPAQTAVETNGIQNQLHSQGNDSMSSPHNRNVALRVPHESGDEPLSPSSHSPHSHSPHHSDGSNESDSDNHPHSTSPNNSRMQSFKRGAWSPQEDERLLGLVETVRPLKWVYIAQEMQTRSSKQCRERYHNYLKPTLTKTIISREEGRKIEELVGVYGKRWAEISRQLPGRSDNAIKNWWNATANRRRNSQDHISAHPPNGRGSVASIDAPSNLRRDSAPTFKLNGGITGAHPVHGVPSSVGQPHAPSMDHYNGIQQLLNAGQSTLSSEPPYHAVPRRQSQPALSMIHPAYQVAYPPHGSPHMVPPQSVPMPSQPVAPSNIPSHTVPPGDSVPPTSYQPLQPTTYVDHHHYPPPVQVTFSGMYAEPQQPINHSNLQPSVLPSNHSHHHHHNHVTSHHSGFSPYPLTPNLRAESRMSSLARSSVSYLGSDSRRSSSVADLRAASPAASPPATPAQSGGSTFYSSYSHYPVNTHGEDPTSLFSRIRQNSEIRRNSNTGSVDATSLSQYSLGTQTRSQSREPSSAISSNVSAELATPPPNLSIPVLSTPQGTSSSTSNTDGNDGASSPRSVAREVSPQSTSPQSASPQSPSRISPPDEEPKPSTQLSISKLTN